MGVAKLKLAPNDHRNPEAGVSEATPLVLDFTMADSDEDGTIDKDEFNKACSAGLVKADEATVKNMK